MQQRLLMIIHPLFRFQFWLQRLNLIYQIHWVHKISRTLVFNNCADHEPLFQRVDRPLQTRMETHLLLLKSFFIAAETALTLTVRRNQPRMLLLDSTGSPCDWLEIGSRQVVNSLSSCTCFFLNFLLFDCTFVLQLSFNDRFAVDLRNCFLTSQQIFQVVQNTWVLVRFYSESWRQNVLYIWLFKWNFRLRSASLVICCSRD